MDEPTLHHVQCLDPQGGEQSDLPSRDTARQMAGRGPHARVHEFAGVGHAPTLVHARHAVRHFLMSP